MLTDMSTSVLEGTAASNQAANQTGGQKQSRQKSQHRYGPHHAKEKAGVTGHPRSEQTRRPQQKDKTQPTAGPGANQYCHSCSVIRDKSDRTNRWRAAAMGGATEVQLIGCTALYCTVQHSTIQLVVDNNMQEASFGIRP